VTKAEKADWLLSANGFWKAILPAICLHATFYIAVALYSLNKVRADAPVVVVAVSVFGFVVLVYFARFKVASNNHVQFKKTYGSRYEKFIDDGKIIINSGTILLLGAPGSLARRYLSENA